MSVRRVLRKQVLKPVLLTGLLFFVFSLPLVQESPGKQNRSTYIETSEDSFPGNTDTYVLKILEGYDTRQSYQKIPILNPLENTLFPSDIASPVFDWDDNADEVHHWLVMVRYGTERNTFYRLCPKPQWTPSRKTWETIKRDSGKSRIRITVLGYILKPVCKIVSEGTVRIAVSGDPVGAPVLFRRVPPSFSYASRHPELMEWCLADVSSYEDPSVVMAGQPFCGSCHTFSANGRKLGMDLDYGGDKGGYFLTELRRNTIVTGNDMFSWNDFPREDGLQNSGLFSRLAPSGEYVASTVNDISFLAKISDPYCSQLFFPIQGHLAYFSKKDGVFSHLFTGEENREVVETDPSWSPDGQNLLFSRTVMKRDLYRELGGNTVFTDDGSGLEKLNEEYPVHFDIYRVPFNKGKGGNAIPVEGASGNGRSNYYARFSPDGSWIVFTMSRTGLVLQPDSRLYIVPSGGGPARILRCNRRYMNSWHTWSPNGRWLAFVSKENTPYTELYLTHINKQGEDSVPVRLIRFNKEGYAINVPEFANIRSGGMRSLTVQRGNGDF